MEYTRFNQRKEHFTKTLKLLDKQMKDEILDDETIAAGLHFFEMTFELSWKLLKDFLEIRSYC